MVNGFPRRQRINLYTPAEKAIAEAVDVVERAGCHPLLTDAVVLLQQAKDKVADFVELPNTTSALPQSPKQETRSKLSGTFVRGYTLEFALANKYSTPIKPRLPKGWRWLNVGEWAKPGDVCCDDRIPPVRILENGWQQTEQTHPVRTRK
jgi:hypothetical protein